MHEVDLSIGNQNQPQYGLWLSLVERCVRDAEVAGSNPVSPTVFCCRPFGEFVKRLSPFRDKSYVYESEVQTNDFE